MPKTQVVFYKELDGSIPVLEWLRTLPKEVAAKCFSRIDRLEEHGYELRRPECDILERGVYELRIRYGHVNYRILYGFAGRQIAVLAHSCTKEKRILPKDIDLAVRRLNYIKANFAIHKYERLMK